MFVRIARFEGGDPERVDEGIKAVRERVAQGPALEGAKEFWMLIDRENRTGLGVTVFESEDALRRGNEALNQMDPPVDTGSQRTSVEMSEVAFKHTVG